jgi:hypothetical protein
MEELCQTPVAQNQHGSAEFRAAQIAKYNFAKPNFESWKRDQWIEANDVPAVAAGVRMGGVTERLCAAGQVAGEPTAEIRR